MIRRQASISFLFGIGLATCRQLDWSWEHAIELFTQLDKIMLEMCEKPERVDELDEECVQRWRRLRIEFVEMTRERNWMASRLQLPDAYFDKF